ncbi:MAG: hypothetical protein FWH53_03385 [Leptospirales bacterium]|nr:hypothetical protein [Leptospirales bacterium]
MKKYYFIFICAAIFTTCTKNVNDDKLLDNSYLNYTENTKLSEEKIDNKETYEVSFNVEKPVECIVIEMEGAYINRVFPNENIPKRVYFIVEKKLQLQQFKSNAKKYMTIGKNFSNDWEITSPVSICVSSNDAFLLLDSSEYRVRFTIFEKIPFYYVLKIRCESKIIFD